MNSFALAAAISVLAGGSASAQETEVDLVNDKASNCDMLTDGIRRHLQRHNPLDTLK